MNRTLLIILFIQILCPTVILAQSKSADHNFTITGKVIGRDTGNLVLMYQNASGNFIKDTVRLEQGNFKFNGSISEPIRVEVQGKLKSFSMDDPNRTWIFLEPGDMQLTLTEKKYYYARLTGSKTQLEFDAYHKSLEPYQIAADSIRMGLSKVSKAMDSTPESPGLNNKFAELKLKSRECYAAIDKKTVEFFSSNPNSYVSPYLMAQTMERLIGLDSAKIIYNNFSETIKKSLWGKIVLQNIIAKAQVITGNDAPDFTAKNIDGRIIRLSQFKNKNYVLLDFWGSWCVKCLKQTPYLKKMYDTYHAKGLEMISISNDSDEKIWKRSIEKHDMGSWYNIKSKDVILQSGLDPAILTKYSIAAYPTVILIDKRGKIIYMHTGFDDDSGIKALEDHLLEALKRDGLQLQ